jgi:hypothetical protein
MVDGLTKSSHLGYLIVLWISLYNYGYKIDIKSGDRFEQTNQSDIIVDQWSVCFLLPRRHDLCK